MSLFKKRPQLQNVEYISPPPTITLHTFDTSDDLPISERAAKRRRIEDYARDYLKGRDIFIASAGLKGPFGNGWRNPWASRSSEKENAGGEETPHVTTVGIEQQEEMSIVKQGPVIPETEVRPVSRAGSDYCHDWLRRQDVEQYSPNLDTSFDNGTDVQEPHEDAETPSRRQPSERAKKQKIVHLDVAPAWTADHPQPDSLQVGIDVNSSVAKRSHNLEQHQNPAARNLRDRFCQRPDPVYDSGIMKVSAITDASLPPPPPVNKAKAKTRPLSRGKLQTAPAPLDSPGFVFRRVGPEGNGKRPFSRGSNTSRASTTQKDPAPAPAPTVNPFVSTSHSRSRSRSEIDKEIWVSVEHIKSPAQLHPQPQPPPQPDQPIQEGLHDEEEDDGEESDGEVVTISVNSEGKWPCPMEKCLKRPRPYASASGVRKHLKSKHGVRQIVTQAGGGGGGAAVAKEKSESKSKGKSLNRVLEMAEPERDQEVVVVKGGVGLDGHVELDDGVHGLAEEHDVQKDAPNNDINAPTPGHHDIAEAADGEHELHPQARPAPPSQEASHDSVIPPDDKEEGTPKASEHQRHEEPTELHDHEQQNAEAKADAQPELAAADAGAHAGAALISTITNPQLPDRQDSRAFSNSAFTINTQAALLQAHLAFQDSQSPEKPTSSPAKLESPTTKDEDTTSAAAVVGQEKVVATPDFRRPGIPSFFQKSIPGAGGIASMSLSKVQPASTQDLINAAAELSFSTGKKTTGAKKKRISFADWGQSKPNSSPAMGGGKFESMKVVEWSPFTEESGETPGIGKGDGGKRMSLSQPEMETPIRSILNKSKKGGKDAQKKSSLSFSHTYTSPHEQPPKSSDPPIPSFTPAQREGSSLSVGAFGRGGGGERQEEEQEQGWKMDESGVERVENGGGMSSLEIENVLDEAESFLSTWDVEREVVRNMDSRGNAVGVGGRRG